MKKDLCEFIFFKENFTVGEIGVNCCGKEQCQPNHSYGVPRNYYLFHIVASGKGKFITGGSTYELGAGSVFLIRPGQEYLYIADSVDPWRYMWVGISGRGADELVKRVAGDEFLFTVSREFIDEYEAGMDFNVVDSDTAAFAVMSVFFKLMSVLCAYVGAAKGSGDVVSGAVHFIENNYFRSFDIGWLAGELGMSRAHFTTVFTRATGVSPYYYLTVIRIRRAKELLVERPDKSIAEVGKATGFASVERFGEMFRKYAGLSPSLYRKKMLAKGSVGDGGSEET